MNLTKIASPQEKNRRLPIETVTGAWHQNGIALIVALLLLVVATLVSLASMRGTLTQHIMAANFYDRELALQSAEAALRVGESAVAGISTAQLPLSNFVLDCSSSSGNACLANPFTDSNVTANASTYIVSVSSSTFNPGAIAADKPRYVVEYMGSFVDRSKGTRLLSNSFNYGGTGGAARSYFYTVTAQSGDPANTGNRAIVTLQTVIKR